ncbi:MAG: T9SS type A sorting domain-containing protein, partial [Bacteroidota bacterium]
LNVTAIKECIVLPDCTIDDCDCDELQSLVQQGVDSIYVGPGPRDYLLRPAAQLSDCDEIQWRVRRLSPNQPWVNLGTGYTQLISFDNDWLYQVQMTVTRVNPDGTTCPVRRASPRYDFRNTSVPVSDETVTVFPNPAHAQVNLQYFGLGNPLEGALVLFDASGNQVRVYPGTDMSDATMRTLNIEGLSPGLYLIRGGGKGETWTKRFVVK